MAFIDDLADLMTDTVTIRSLTGRDDFGAPTYDAGTEYPARVVRRHKLVRDLNGDEVVATGEVWLAGAPTLDPDDQVELSDGTTPHVLTVERFQDEVGSSHTKLMLR